MAHTLDFIERVRCRVWPLLHLWLTRVGLYATGHVNNSQYVGRIQLSEDEFERRMFHEYHFERNPVAALKEHSDGRESTLSLRLTQSGAEKYQTLYVEPGMQLHLTLFEAAEGGLDIFAHYEDDWEASPRDHLDGTNFSAAEGVKRARALFKNETGIELDADD